MRSIMYLRLPILLTVALVACVPAEPPRGGVEPSAPERPAEGPASAGSLRPGIAEREPEPPLAERWRSPFGVSSSGRTVAREGRTVVVLRGDSTFTARDRAALTAAPAPPRADPDRLLTPAESVEMDDSESVEVEARFEPARAPGLEVAFAALGSSGHLVERGDTWGGIARRYEVTSAALGQANPGVDPERIEAGQYLRIPARSAAPSGGTERTHQVRPGDTLSGLAQRYNVSPQQLREANRLSDDRIRIGQDLLIPEPIVAR